jgi:SAM-dependent methyltransferase
MLQLDSTKTLHRRHSGRRRELLGIDTHALNFIRYAAKKQSLGRVATLGRQGLLVLRAYAESGAFCEEFLKNHLGAIIVDSYDYSDYEGATYVVDMNKPFCPSEHYDTVIDCGCMEHIYNAPQAFLNLSRLCAPGGQIIHVAPANNFCGHGFWQFSPELFFSLYSNANGYSQTDVFLADLTNNHSWFEVRRPSNGQRAEVLSRSPLYVLCRTVRVGDISHDNVQQSDYITTWSSGSPRKTGNGAFVSGLKQGIKKTSPAFALW